MRDQNPICCEKHGIIPNEIAHCSELTTEENQERTNALFAKVEQLSAELGELREKCERQNKALDWAREQAKGNLPKWFHESISPEQSGWLTPSEAKSLRAWKAEVLQVESEWDVQKLAKLLGANLGESCRAVIGKRVPELMELALCLSAAWYFQNWKAVTANERKMESIMEQLGLWPTSEDEILRRIAEVAKAKETEKE